MDEAEIFKDKIIDELGGLMNYNTPKLNQETNDKWAHGHFGNEGSDV